MDTILHHGSIISTYQRMLRIPLRTKYQPRSIIHYLASIGAYILILVFESIVGRMFIPLFAKIGFSEDEFLNFTMIFIVGVIAAAAFSAVYFFVCKYLMEKHLNLN